MIKKHRLDKNFRSKMYGSATVGSRGQVVIPAPARKDLGIKTGDRLIVVTKMGKALGLVKSDDLLELLNTFLTDVDTASLDDIKAIAKKDTLEILKKLKKK